MATLDLKVNLFSLGNSVDDAAEYLKKWLIDLAADIDGVTGYISIGDFNGVFASPQMDLFSDFFEGDISVNEQKYLISEWLKTHFAEGIEWANVFAYDVAEKIAPSCDLKKSNNIEHIQLDNGGIICNSPKKINHFSTSDWKEYYPYLRKCLRPGYSDIDLQSLARNRFNIFVEPSNFKVANGEIHFQRGSFELPCGI